MTGPMRGGTEKKRTKKRQESYNTYIYKVLRQVHSDTGISAKVVQLCGLEWIVPD